jgi:hypothetical protein
MRTTSTKIELIRLVTGSPIKSVEDYIKPIAAMTQDHCKTMAAEVNTMALQAKNIGLKFAYHNRRPFLSAGLDVLCAG